MTVQPQCGRNWSHDPHTFGRRHQWNCDGSPTANPHDPNALQDRDHALGAYDELTPDPHAHSVATCAHDIEGLSTWWLCGHEPFFTTRMPAHVAPIDVWCRVCKAGRGEPCTSGQLASVILTVDTDGQPVAACHAARKLAADDLYTLRRLIAFRDAAKTEAAS